ncbi:MAG: hypothetical protein V7734_07395 [Maribacter arcticus]|uniref:DUF6952 family protein n=1 Tax=Maribacter arcticus TaxID=561365 RepID=UPI0030018D53
MIKLLTEFIEEKDSDYILETIETLEALTELPSLKDEELDVIGELISNMYGALDVANSKAHLKKSLNQFMLRMMGSIDK